MYAQAADLAGRLLRSSHIVGSQRSACECVIGLVQWDAGDLNSGISHFQRAVVQAEAAKDFTRKCWAELRLLILLAGRAGPQGVSQLLAQTRQDVIRLGDPLLFAA